MEYRNILVERDNGVGIITFNRPEVLNALNMALWRELNEAITDFEQDPRVGAVIVTGKGKRAFSAGADIHEMAAHDKDSNSSYDEERAEYIWHMASCSKPTIGVINGLAYGGGAVIATSLDIRIGSENCSFRFLAAAYGRINSTWNLPLQVGWSTAKDLLFTARVVNAEEAQNIGLINHMFPSKHLMENSLKFCKTIAENDQRMVQGIKKIMIDNIGSDWERMYLKERKALRGNLKPTPISEGFKEFLEKKGR